MVIDDIFSNKENSKHDIEWWNKPTENLSYAQYQVGSTQVLVGNRPNYAGTTKEFYDSVDGWINVSDRFVRHNQGKLNMFIPWNEAGKPSYEAIFSVLKTLHYWIDEQKVSRVYIHCDGGTHRAVSMFGFYLLAYHAGKSEEINNSKILVKREHWSNPLLYAQTYLKDVALLKEFLAALPLSTDHPNHGHSFEEFLKSLQNQELLAQYYRDRLINKDLPYIWHMIVFSVKFFIKNQTIGRWEKIVRWGHKKLNTKTGKTLKRLGL